MCGIAGILRVTAPGEAHQPIPERWLDLLDADISWRGPDGAGRFRDIATREDGATVEVALVHRRLAIIDVEGGHQPMVSERGRAPVGDADNEEPPEGLIAVVFNGCIYNHRALRATLEERGHLFETSHSDTEVLIHGYREWGLAWFGLAAYDGEPRPQRSPVTRPMLDELHRSRLDGMFAFALWDGARARLVLGRDMYDRKPLYEWSDGAGLSVFASTAPAIAAVREASQTDHSRAHESGPSGAASRDGLVRWVAQGFDRGLPGLFEVERGAVLPRRTLAAAEPVGVGTATARAIMAGIGLVLAMTGVVAVLIVVLLFSTVFVAGIVALLIVLPIVPARLFRAVGLLSRPPSPKEIDQVEAMIERSVVDRLEADVPLGCFLSGGVDSSLIALYAQRNAGDVTTVCVRMPDDRYDESPYAAEVARAIGTRHITIDCPADPAADLVRLIETLGLPFGDSSILPTYWLCRAARAHMKVALSGDGGDELFCGYERYKAAAWLGSVGRLPLRVPERLLDRSDPRARSEKVARLNVARRRLGYTDLVSIFPSPDLEALLGRAQTATRRHIGRVTGADGARDWDLSNYLPLDLMRKVDTASMLCGLEVRCPFLSNELSDAMHRRHARHLMPGGELKGWLRMIARGHFPPEITDRPKQGFAIPIGEWFRTDFGGMRSLLMDLVGLPAAAGAPPFGALHDALEIDLGAVTRMIDEHMAAGDHPAPSGALRVRRRDHSQRLFLLCSLAIWGATPEAATLLRERRPIRST